MKAKVTARSLIIVVRCGVVLMVLMVLMVGVYRYSKNNFDGFVGYTFVLAKPICSCAELVS